MALNLCDSSDQDSDPEESLEGSDWLLSSRLVLGSPRSRDVCRDWLGVCGLRYDLCIAYR